MGRAEEIQQAFSRMQAAETAKDIDPEAYRKARIAYYTLSKGDAWIEAEKARLGAEADKQIAQWQSQYDTLLTQRAAQRDNLELVRAAEDNQLGMLDDVEFAVDQLKRLVEKEKDKKNVDERLTQFSIRRFDPPGWLYTLLDAILAILLLYACYLLFTLYPDTAPAAPSFLPTVR